MSKLFISTLFILVLTVSCKTNIQYIGRNYAPTNKIDVFLKEQDVKQGYETIGKVVATGSPINRGYERMQNKIVEEAKKRGADAIILSDMQVQTTDPVVTTTTTGEKKASVTGGEEWKNTTVTSTNTYGNLLLNAVLIKYK